MNEIRECVNCGDNFTLSQHGEKGKKVSDYLEKHPDSNEDDFLVALPFDSLCFYRCPKCMSPDLLGAEARKFFKDYKFPPKGERKRYFGEIGLIPIILGALIGIFIYNNFINNDPGVTINCIVATFSAYIFGIPIRLLIDKLKSNK